MGAFREFLKPCRALVISALLGIGVLGGVILGNTGALQAAHGPCDNNDVNLHVHWYRSSAAPVHDVVYDVDVQDENGAFSGTYANVISADIGEWNDEQGFIDFTTSGNLDVDMTVDIYTEDFLGSTSTSPAVCTNVATHLGTGTIKINSGEIEGLPTNKRVHARYAVVSHELGHVIGLGHIDDDSLLMYGAFVDNTPWGPLTEDIDNLDVNTDPYGHLH